MMTPQKPEGDKAKGKVQALFAIHALQTALPMVGVMSEDGKVIMEAIRKLVGHFGKSEETSQSLMPAELASVFQKAAGPGAPPPTPGQPPQGAQGAGAAPPMAAAA